MAICLVKDLPVEYLLGNAVPRFFRISLTAPATLTSELPRRGAPRRQWHRRSWRLIRLLLGCRYRVTVIDGQLLSQLNGPTLILPNHPAYIDPAIILGFLPLQLPVRPLVYVDTYRHPVLHHWLRWLGALEVPDLRRERRAGRDQMKTVIDGVVTGLGQNEGFLLYPSGRLQRGRYEIVGTARATHEILQRVPDLTLVLVRCRGVWGSMFSCADKGDVPNLSAILWWSLLRWICGLGIFLPKRPVSLTCRVADSRELAAMGRSELNAWLESWYNADGGENPQHVPYHPWFGRRTRGFGRLVDAACHSHDQPSANSASALGWRSRAAIVGRRWRLVAGQHVSRLRVVSERLRRRR